MSASALKQMEAACTVSYFEAVRVLAPERIDKPDGQWFRLTFDFTGEELKAYISSHAGLAQTILQRSYDQRATPSAYVQECAGGYDVGVYDRGASDRRFHTSIEDAVTDFVMLFWHMPRWSPE